MIRGEKVILRTFRERDLDPYVEIVNDSASLTPYWPAFLQSEPNLRKEFSESGFLKEDYKVLLVTDKEGAFIGEVTSFKTSPNLQGPEVAYRIFREENRRKGYATEALRLFSAYLFRSEANILRLTAMIRTDNAASISLIQKCGYQKEGTLRNAEMHSGVPHSYEVFSLLRDECPKLEELTNDAPSG
ncbi:MAG: GNAT family protein [Verrucomicrobiales bacterium]|nr:GNAT family protein [Verrucomicrobiales bacterium]